MSNPKKDFPWPNLHVTGTTLVSPRPGTLHTIVVNGLTAVGDVTVHDGLDATGRVVAVLHLNPATSVSVQPITFLYDAKIDTGIYIVFDEQMDADLTVTFI